MDEKKEYKESKKRGRAKGEKSQPTLPNPTAYSGAYKLLKATKPLNYTRNEVENWLEHQVAYTLHKLPRYRLPRRIYNVKNLDDVWEFDLADFRSIKSHNDDYAYVFICIDVLSKYAFTEPMQNKTANVVRGAFERILDRSDNRYPVCCQSDRGGKFTGREMQNLLKECNIEFGETRNPDVKAAIAERFIRTLKQNIWRYFTQQKTRRYIDVLPQIIEAYNNSWHSGIRMAPADVNYYNAHIAYANLVKRYGAHARKPDKYQVGDSVRIRLERRTFQKSYEGTWSDEVFRITRISSSREPHVYYIEDLQGEPLDTFFYEQELSRVHKENFEDDEVDISEILEMRGTGKKKECFVSWKNWPAKYNC